MNRLGKLLNYHIEENRLHLSYEKGQAFLAVIKEDIIRVYHDPKKEGAASKAIEKELKDFRDFKVERTSYGVELGTKALTVKVWDDFYIDFYDAEGNCLVKDYRKPVQDGRKLTSLETAILEGEGHTTSKDGEWELYVAKEMTGDECFYGLGDKTGFMNKRHYDYIMWNTDDPAPQVDSFKSLYKSIPFFITLKEQTSYGIFFDNTFKSYFDMGKSSDEYYMFGANNGAMDYYFIHGSRMADVIGGYTFLTGTTPLPQLWTLGYHQSRWGYRDEKDIREVAEKMRQYQIPCDVIHMDIDYMDGYRVFTWDRERHQDPKAEIQQLAQKGFKIVTIVDPGVKKDKGYPVYEEGLKQGYFAKDKDGVTYVNAVWPGDAVFPDYGNEEVRKWWGEKHEALLEMGVQGIWNDMNEPASFKGPLPDDVVFRDGDRETTHKEIHNVYGHLMAKATHDYLKEATGRRPFVITRACYSGSQKYTTAWTGDNHSIWAHLQMAIPQLCNLGLSGMSFVGTDIGGFGSDTTPELLTRWIQLGCFSPLCRNHAALGTRRQEPWQFDEKTLSIYKKYVRLRYALLPYLYDLFYEGEQNGLPVIRPLVLEYEKDEIAKNCNDQFMVGSRLLVSPVVMQGAVYKTVYLPEGIWYDFWTHEKYEGGKPFTYHAPIECCPVFVREGTILPMYEPMQYVGEHPLDTLILNVYGDSAHCIHYQDNKTDFAYKEGEYNLYEFKYENGRLFSKAVHTGYSEGYKKIIVKQNGKEVCVQEA